MCTILTGEKESYTLGFVGGCDGLGRIDLVDGFPGK
jgi:hypothetical protein